MDYSGIETFRDITLSGRSNIDAAGLGGGDIQVAGRNISITGVSGFSAITLGLIPGGDINVFASESLQISGIENEDNFVSYISTRIFPGGIADGGDINIETGSLIVGDRALIRTSVSGQGNAGDVNINATEEISLVSEGNTSSILSNVGTDAIGNGGNINIMTSSLTLSNGASINADTSGQGNGGNITINATESISLEGQSTSLPRTLISSFANPTATGNAGNINVTTGSLTLNNGARLATASFSSNPTSAGDIIVNASDAVSFTNGSTIFVTGANGGFLTINAKSLELTSGSGFVAGISIDSGSADAQAGDITINLTEDLVIDGIDSESTTNISNTNFSTGNAGNVFINARNINFINGGVIFNFNNGQGNIGDVLLNATGDIVFDGAQIFLRSGISNFVGETGAGNVGKIEITAHNLSITNGAFVQSLVGGNANAGDININVFDTILVDNSGGNTVLTNGTVTGFPSGITSQNTGNGNSGNININTQNLFLSRNGEVSASIFGTGNGGDININADVITIGEQGNTVTSPSSISSEALTGAFSNTILEANAGNITIDTRLLSISDGGNIQANVSGIGNGGNITINATETISVDGTGILNDIEVRSSISSNILSNSVGNAGGLIINTPNLSITNNASISSDISGIGDSGDIEISTTDFSLTDNSLISASILSGGQGTAGSVTINVNESLNLSETSLIVANINENAIGSGGNLFLQAENLTLTDRSLIGVSTSGEGNAGSITINVNESLNLSEKSLVVASINENAIGSGGNLFLQAENLTLTDARIGAITSGEGDAGSVTINVNGSFNLLENSLILASVSEDAIGSGGNLFLQAENLTLADDSLISTSTLGQGTAGSITINVAENLTLVDDSLINTSTLGEGNAGSVTINANGSVELLGGSDIGADVSEDAIGSGGNLFLQAENLTLADGSQISASTFSAGNAGSVTIRVDDTIELIGFRDGFGRSGIFTNAVIGSGNGGDLNVFTDNLILRDGSTVQASNFQSLGLSQTGSGNSGDVNISAEAIVAFPNQNNDIIANALQGNGGNINITADAILGIAERPQNPITNDIDASSQATGLDGTVTISNPDINSLQGVDRLPTNPVSAKTIATDACSATGGKTNLIIKGKDGIPPEPNTPLPAESLLLDDRAIALDQNPHYIPAYIKPVKTDNGDIYPARGVIVQEDGTVILTAYSNDEQNNRVPQTAANCNS